MTITLETQKQYTLLVCTASKLINRVLLGHAQYPVQFIHIHSFFTGHIEVRVISVKPFLWNIIKVYFLGAEGLWYMCVMYTVNRLSRQAHTHQNSGEAKNLTSALSVKKYK